MSVRVPLRDENDLIRRLVCHAFVSFMPPEGLEESLAALVDYFDYHRPQQEALPSPEQTVMATGTVVKVIPSGAR